MLEGVLCSGVVLVEKYPRLQKEIRCPNLLYLFLTAVLSHLFICLLFFGLLSTVHWFVSLSIWVFQLSISNNLTPNFFKFTFFRVALEKSGIFNVSFFKVVIILKCCSFDYFISKRQLACLILLAIPFMTLSEEDGPIFSVLGSANLF